MPLRWRKGYDRHHTTRPGRARDAGAWAIMIDIRKLKELVKLMVENDLSELDLRDKEETVLIKRGAQGVPVVGSPIVQMGTPTPVSNGAPSETPEQTPPVAPQDDTGDDGLVSIDSPMVGTFYTSPNPDAEPFVKVGDQVTPDTVVCIIEAMKVFNEIKAECSGTVARVLVGNGESVEFGQKLFLVKPA